MDKKTSFSVSVDRYPNLFQKNPDTIKISDLVMSMIHLILTPSYNTDVANDNEITKHSFNAENLLNILEKDLVGLILGLLYYDEFKEKINENFGIPKSLLDFHFLEENLINLIPREFPIDAQLNFSQEMISYLLTKEEYISQIAGDDLETRSRFFIFLKSINIFRKYRALFYDFPNNIFDIIKNDDIPENLKSKIKGLEEIFLIQIVEYSKIFSNNSLEYSLIQKLN